jgi:hypothetical protein
METEAHVRDARNVFVRSCAVLDHHLVELGYPSLSIVDRDEHKKLASAHPSNNAPEMKRCAMDGFDDAPHYDARVFSQAASSLCHRLSARISAAREKATKAWGREHPKILVIDRGPPDRYFLSALAEIGGSGTQRRSIKNFNQMSEALTAEFKNVRVDRLEGKSLSYQLALFQEADIVVAQHGAALANLVWAHPRIGTVEILPRGLRPNISVLFEDLAGCLGQRYEQVAQVHPHDEVSIDEVVGALHRLTNGRPAG